MTPKGKCNSQRSHSQHNGPAKPLNFPLGLIPTDFNRQEGMGPPIPSEDFTAPPPKLLSLVSRSARLWAAPQPGRGGWGTARGRASAAPESRGAAGLHGPGPLSSRPSRPGALGARPGRRAAPLPPGYPSAHRKVSHPPRAQPGRTVPSERRKVSG